MALLLILLWLMAYGAASFLYRRGKLAAPYHKDVLALGLLALGTAGFFWRLLFTPGVWMPADGGDLVSFLYPTYHFAAESLKRGEIPLWNPYLYGGAPFVGDIQAGLFYPVNLLFFLLTPQLTYRTLELMAVFHFWLAGAAMYLCLRYLEGRARSMTPALVGAMAFMFSDLFITHFGNLNMIAVAAWLPLIFLCYHRALTGKQVGWALATGVLAGIATLAGHIQPTLHIALALGLYLGYRLCLAWREGWRAMLRPIGLSLLAVAVAFGLTAPILLPGYEMSQLSIRAQITYQEASQFSLSPAHLIGLVVPGFFGRGPRAYWGPWPRVEVGYLGVFPLVLAGLALLLRRDRLTRFLAGLAVVALLLALGEGGILHGWLYRWVPGFGQLRAPARFIYLMDFALAALAALGLEVLLRPMGYRRRMGLRRLLRFLPWALLLTVLLVLPSAYTTFILAQDKDPTIFWRIGNALGAVVFFLLLLGASVAWLFMRGYGWLGRRALGGLAVALVAFDLFSLGAYLDLGERDPTANFDHPAAIAFLKADPDLYRLDTRTDIWAAWQPNLSLLHGIFDVGGIWTPLALADYDRYWEHTGSRSSPLYDFLNAKYVVGAKNVPLDWSKFELAFGGDPRVNIYRNTRAMPRAFLVYRSQVLPDHQAALAALHQSGFDPATGVILEGGEALEGAPDQGGSVHITRYTLNEIVLSVDAPAEAYLVLSEVYYPGWRAYVDGQAEPIQRANYAFRAVRVGPGLHEVRLTFEPLWWRVGVILSVVTGLGLVASSLVPIRRLFSEEGRRGEKRA